MCPNICVMEWLRKTAKRNVCFKNAIQRLILVFASRASHCHHLQPGFLKLLRLLHLGPGVHLVSTCFPEKQVTARL